jgi:hypothetical protein
MSSRIGGFCETRRSQYVPLPTWTARKSVGIAAEARTMSTVISSRRLLKALNSPDSTSTAPTRSSGAVARSTMPSRAMWRSSSARKS